MRHVLKRFTEWGISLKLKALKTKLWFNIFIRIAVIFLALVLIIAVSNVTLLVKFFSFKEKKALKEQTVNVAGLDFTDTDAVVNALSEINEKYNFDIEIYSGSGAILYTTHGGQMMDFFRQDNGRFNMSHESMTTLKSEDLGNGITFETAVRNFDKSEFLLCRKQVGDNLYAEVRIQKQLIANSAAVANEFIIIVSFVCLLVSIVWVLLFARRFSKPITEMNEITKDMARLDFGQHLKVKSSDEIGQLAVSVNELSDSLSGALEDLRETNEKLRDEIELERQLDVMRKGFVANVSHELKTPISIISGYAEGLKLGVNASDREEYCNTIIDESGRMNRLVLSILELSKYESGQIPVNRQSFDISVMCNEMLTRIFGKTDIVFKNLIPENTVVFADEMQIEQVFKAYLENALAHTPERGEVEVQCRDEGEAVRISVFNSGSHISDELMPQIWQSFFRGDKSHKREGSRFGLGLSIVAAIMKMHERKCGVYNTENGVCFWFEADKPKN